MVASFFSYLKIQNNNMIKESDYIEAANRLGCEVAAIKAVAEVESMGDGFLKSGEPKILFERHIFSRLTKGIFDSIAPDISNRQAGGYYGGVAEHKRLQKAVQYDRDKALQSASWGRFQIMGFNYALAGYKDIQTFINAAYNSESDHLNMFVGFVQNTGLDRFLRTKQWAKFAEGYNGKAYKKNNYDTKIALAYLKYLGK